jgi:hypothetical protein
MTIAAAAAKLRAKSFTLDGEAVVVGADGVAVFDALHGRHKASETLVRFRPFGAGEDLRPRPLSEPQGEAGAAIGTAAGWDRLQRAHRGAGVIAALPQVGAFQLVSPQRFPRSILRRAGVRAGSSRRESCPNRGQPLEPAPPIFPQTKVMCLEAAVTLEKMEAQIVSLREQVLQIKEQQERARKDQLLWSRINVGVGGVLMMIAGFAGIFQPPSPIKPVLLMFALFAMLQSRFWSKNGPSDAPSRRPG